MFEGTVERVSADATEAPSVNTRSNAPTGRDRPMGPLAYRMVAALKNQALEADAGRFLISPVQRAFHEAAQVR